MANVGAPATIRARFGDNGGDGVVGATTVAWHVGAERLIKYLGSKRRLVPDIVAAVGSLLSSGTVIDLFSGTSRVGMALKAQGYRVLANDNATYAATLARCYVQADRDDHLVEAGRLVAEANRLAGTPGYFTSTFCEEARYFQPCNGERIDAIRDWIEARSLPDELEAIMLVSLMEAADRVDSTTGVQMAYLKRWATRSNNRLELRVPELIARPSAGKCAAYQSDAADAARTLSGDLAYLDPPYNQHNYLGNYHIWETLVRWDAPATYGVANKRIDVKERRSEFNSRPRCRAAFADVVDQLDVGHLVVSFSDEGFIARDDMIEILSARGPVEVVERDYQRYVGAQIGVHDPNGKRVGTPTHLRNTEYLFIVSGRR